jgi:hypothetical protein
MAQRWIKCTAITRFTDRILHEAAFWSILFWLICIGPARAGFFFAHIANRGVDLLLNAAPSMPAEPAPVIKDPFPASTSYFVPKGALSPVWKIGICCRKDQIIRGMEL